jgi:hypothetical protein
MKSDALAPEDKSGLRRELSRADGIALVVGTVIGSEIFLVRGPIAGHLY